MKLHLTTTAGLNMITGYAPGHVQVNGRRHETSLVVLPDLVQADWLEGGFAELVASHFEIIVLHRPEIVLLGTGSRQHFPQPALYRGLIEAHIGLEVMDTGAACRTYNILAAEGRRVAAALILQD